MTKLCVVLWKNFIIRKFHWCATLFEIIIPVGLFVLIAYARSEITDFGKEYVDKPTYNPQYTSEVFYHQKFNRDANIYYAPTTAFTSRLMKAVQLLFSLPNEAIEGFASVSDLNAYHDQHRNEQQSVLAVVFNNAGDETPKSLNYMIRPYETFVNWETNSYYNRKDFYIQESGSDNYINRGFMALKMAIDTSFLEIVSQKQNPITIVMQEFPYPPYYRDLGMGDMFFTILPLATVFGFLIISLVVIKSAVEEKSTGIKELMKMMGLKSWMLWLGWFVHMFFVNAIAIVLITLLMKGLLWSGKTAVLEFCDITVFLVFLLLYVAAGITFCFTLSTLFHKPTIAALFGCLVWILSYTIPSDLVAKSVTMKLYKKVLVSLLPNVAMSLGYRTIALFESRQMGVNWTNLFISPTGGVEDITMGHIFIMLIVDIILYTVLTFYIEAVNPGPYGLAKPATFPLMFLCKSVGWKGKNSVLDRTESKGHKKYCKVEKAVNLKPGIQVKNLYKKFGKQSVVNGLSMDIYEGQITALLGHNGAGKTTTMSIITGLIGATSGEVWINGKNTKRHMGEIRNSLGLCPQHNLHFSDLTVMQHLMFFGMLKGMSKRDAIAEGETLLSRMNISQKKHSLASSLSGGMKRKLSLAIALIGNTKVVILDEPTSGLDPESRREIWDMLLSLRGSRTILITTHFMEEADVLGDRIAIMDHGRLMCYGTSMFLKKEYGAGYHLSLICDSDDQSKEISKVVKDVIPKAKLQGESGNYVTFLLPHEKKSLFSSLFEKLEEKKEALGISNMSLSVTTLEEVFIRVGNMALKDKDKPKHAEHEDTTDNHSCASVAPPKRKGGKKTTMQVWSLFKKRILVAKKKWFIYVSQTLLAALLTVMTLYLGDTVNTSTDSLKTLEFNLSVYGDTIVIYGGAEEDEERSKMMEQYQKLVSQQSARSNQVANVSEAILEEGIKSIEFYNHHLVVAAEFNKTVLNAMYSNKALHGAPISFNLLINAVLKGIVGEEYEIVSGNFPLQVSNEEHVGVASEIEIAVLWLLIFCLGMLLLASIFLLFPHMERVTNIKQLQLMCGVRSCLYWISCYIWDLILYFIAVFIILCVVVIYGAKFSRLFSGADEIVALTAILTAYGFSVIPFAYLFSYKKTAAAAVGFFLIINLILSQTLIGVVLFMEMASDKYRRIAVSLKYILFLFPQFGLSYSCLMFSKKVAENHNWKLKSLEEKHVECQFRPNPCCGGDETPLCLKSRSYIYADDGISQILLEMSLSTILYFAILLFLETAIVYRIWDKFLVCLYNLSRCGRRRDGRDVVDSAGHEDVSYESRRVYDTLHRKGNGNSNGDEFEDLLLVYDLQKMYWGEKVVKGISFGIKPGDCFGLLGVNGAGKTTTFRMLTGDQPVLRGEARIHATGDVVSINKQTKKYLEKVGYCPQFDAFNEVLTGREMLTLFAELRGIREDVEKEVCMWIKALGLVEYADQRCGLYSGGNKRKLSIAVALIGSPLLVMLDEPTSGVDPISRRKLWDIVNLVQSQTVKPSIILTSHSMEECEVLCNKLAIMKAGQFECYGTIPQLKEKYGQGFTVMLKLKPSLLNIVVNPLDRDDVDSPSSQSRPLTADSKPEDRPRATTPTDDDSEEIRNLMESFENKYEGQCTLRDKHSGLLHYHISDKTKKWSALFREIEQLKQDHPIIEDYNISETTLEEVFLSIARSNSKPAAQVVL